MQRPCSSNNAERKRFLFVRTKEEDTTFLTKGLPVEVIHSPDMEWAEVELKKQSFAAVFVDDSANGGETLGKIRERHETPMFLLAQGSDLSTAIHHVRGGLDGFLVKGVSNPDSVLRLIDFATRSREQ